MLRKSHLLTLICLLCFSTFNACKKDDSANKSARLNVNFSSIYEISNVKIAVFEGWVDAGPQDLEEESKRFYAVYRSNDSKVSLELEPNPYTVLVYYKDFGAIYVEKIDLKSAGETVNIFFNKPLELSVGVNRLVYLPNEKMNFSYSSISILGGVQVALFVNEMKVDVSANQRSFEYTLIKDGINNVELKATYINGQSNTDNYEVLVVPQRNIENIWKSIDEKYLKQKIFNSRSLVALEKDTMIQNNLVYANTIIDGLYGVFKFKFEKGFLSEIEVNHGNIDMDPNFNFEPIKQKLQTLYGNPIENSYRNYSFTSGDYVVNLSMDSQTNVVSRITRLK